MELTHDAGPAARTRRARVSGWVVASGCIAFVFVAPLLALPASLFRDGFGLDTLTRLLLPDALRTSLVLAAGVGIGTLVVGGGLAVLVSFYDFPGRRVLDWALVLPMAMPGYVLVFVVLGQYGLNNPLQSSLFDGFRIPGIRTTFGGICILTAVLYPYVYVLGRSAFLGQSRQTLEAARSLGRTRWGAIRSVALPLARPALAGGVAIAVMEALADFGTVNLLGIRALTNAIYRVWNGAFDETAALQLATVLLTLTLALITIERLLRGRARYNQSLARGDAVEPEPLRGWKRWAAPVAPGLLLLVAFVLPVAQLVAWSIETIRDGTTVPDLRDAAWNTAFLGVVTAAIAPVIAIVLVYGMRLHGSRVNRIFTRLSTLGYAIPGTVIAVAVYVPLVWLDRRFVDIADAWFDRSIDLVFTGSILGLVFAYLVRFNALSFLATEARMQHVDPRLDDAARSLGADRSRVLADVHLPLLRPGLLAGALLVLVEVMKELPATALLRPLGRDTLAITVWEATKDSRLDAAALPALLIVLVGLVPVVVLVRLLRSEGWTSAADRIT